MSDRPILFSAPMVRRLLDGSKTQTRRVVNPQPSAGFWVPYRCPDWRWNWVVDKTGMGSGDPFRCPYGVPGDRLWVRETWAPRTLGQLPEIDRHAKPRYRATEDLRPEWGNAWKPSIHMPRWASRITLEVTGVRVERLQEIDEAGAVAEGMAPRTVSAFRVEARADFCALWNTINGPDSWDANPWVWVVEFRRLS